MARARHMFAGGNTCLGFFSYYHHILPQEEAEKIYVIKGGPGVGKSTFMKKVAHAMMDRGFDVEFMHCSSDSDSLDGVVVRDLKTFLVDGTAPHIIDPKYPGAVDEILNFGAFWNEEEIKKHRKEILSISREISRLFARAYHYLHAAFEVYQDSASFFNKALDKIKLSRLIADLEEELFAGKDGEEGEGRERSLFASAITPSGYVNYLNTLLDVSTVYVIKGDMGAGEELLLERLRDTALSKGFDVEGFYCALNPHKLEHLIIPGLDAAVTTSNTYHHAEVPSARIIDMMELMDRKLLEQYRGELEENRQAFDGLMATALASIRRAKENHDALEQFYIPYMDFKAMDASCQQIIGRLAELRPTEEIASSLRSSQ